MDAVLLQLPLLLWLLWLLPWLRLLPLLLLMLLREPVGREGQDVAKGMRACLLAFALVFALAFVFAFASPLLFALAFTLARRLTLDETLMVVASDSSDRERGMAGKSPQL